MSARDYYPHAISRSSFAWQLTAERCRRIGVFARDSNDTIDAGYCIDASDVLPAGACRWVPCAKIAGHWLQGFAEQLEALREAT